MPRQSRRLGRLAAGPAAAFGLAVAATVAPARADDAALGAKLFQAQCAVCHTTIPEYHKEGPSLAGVYGRRAGTAPFFAGYKSLKGSTVVWNDHTLDAWLADPRAFGDGKDTKMTVKVDDPAQRAALISYLRTLR